MKKCPRYFRIVTALVVVGAVGMSTGMWLAHQHVLAKNKAPAPGEAMPGFELPDVEKGLSHTLKEHKGSIVVLNFCSQKCPFSLGVDPQMNALARQYTKKGVVFYGIDSHRATPPEEIQQYRLKAKVPYPILKDEGNEYADRVDAKVTPEIYIVDKEGKLAYHGAFDNRKGPKKPGDKNYVRMALDALESGVQVSPDRVKAWGCGIKRAN